MARFHAIWRVNPSAPSTYLEPHKYLVLMDELWAVIDEAMKKGEIEEWGVFPDAQTGYCIGKGETLDIYRVVSMLYPYFVFEVHDIISYEKQKEIIRTETKARIGVMGK